MANRLEQILDFNATGQPVADVQTFLERFGAFATVAHEQRVAYAITRLALQYEVSRRQAEVAAWLHDLSAVIPNEERVAACRQLNVELLPLEVDHPILSHGKLSRALAELVLGVEDRAVLDAVQYHTTLRAKATKLDKVVFLADKLESDNPKRAKEYSREIRAGADQSLDAGCLAYLQYVVDNCERLGWPLHPDLSAAHAELAALVKVAPPRPVAPPPVVTTREPRPPKPEKTAAQPKFVISGPLVSRPPGSSGKRESG